jgi:hypothetical protein
VWWITPPTGEPPIVWLMTEQHGGAAHAAAEVARDALTRVRRVAELHTAAGRPNDHGFLCSECRKAWPCPTQLALGPTSPGRLVVSSAT